MPTITSNAFSSLQKKLKAANIEYSKAVMEIASGLSAKDLLSQIGLSKKEVEAIFINGRITPFDTVIKDGNRVAVVPNFTAEPYRNLQGLKNIWRIENTRIISGEKKQMITLNSELTIKNMSFKNRLVLPPITTNYGTSKGLVTQDILHFYKERSKDMGLVIVEATSVQSNGRIVPCSLGLWDDSQIPGMIKLAKTIQKQGAIAVVQLNHAGPRCIPLKSKRHGFSPSGVAFRPDVEPIIMNTQDIEQLVNDFSKAAIRAKKAGFDGIEIHGAHLYLLSQFLSPLTNKRDDRYGGNAKGRATLALEIVKDVRKKLGSEYPIFFRINAEEKIDGGQTLEDALAIGRLLADEGVDVFDVTLIAQGGWKEVGDKKFIIGSSALSKDQPSGANVAFTAVFKKEIGLPVIAVGKFGIGQAAVNAVRNEKIEMIAIGRQMICDPQTAKKMLDGNDDDIIPCDECLKCFATIGKGVPMACKINQNLPF